MTPAFYQPMKSQQIIHRVKKSEFIARLLLIQNKPEMEQALQQARHDYPDARHYCSAYLLGPPSQPCTMASSDDGEPSGTAGKPILNVIQHKNIGNIGVIVIRYFGGIKLGAGGLVRAYSAATQLVIEQSELALNEPFMVLTVNADFSDESKLRYVAKKYSAEIIACEYSRGIAMQINLRCKDLVSFEAEFQNSPQVLISNDVKAM